MDVVVAHSHPEEEEASGDEDYQWLVGNRSCVPSTALMSVRDAETIINTIVSLFGLPMTFLVLSTQLLSNRIYRPNTPTLYLTNLYFANLMTTLMIPFVTLTNRAYATGTPLGCKLVSLIYYASCTAGFASLILISVNRYRVLHQRTQRPAASRKRTYAILGCTWLASLMCAAPAPLYTTTMLRESPGGGRIAACVVFFEYDQVKTLLVSFKILLCLFWGVAPVVMMSWFYLFFYRRLRLASCRRRSQTLAFISTLMLSFLILQTPYIAILSWESYAVLAWDITCESIVRRDATAVLARVVPHLHCLLNPVLYAFLGRDFKQRLAQCLRGELLDRRRALRARAGVHTPPPTTAAPSWTSGASGTSKSWSLPRALTSTGRQQPDRRPSEEAPPGSPKPEQGERTPRLILTRAALRRPNSTLCSRDPAPHSQKGYEPSATSTASSPKD